MAKLERKLNANFDSTLRRIENGIISESVSASLEGKSDFSYGDIKCSIRVFERYSYTGKNRVSLTVTLFGKDGDLQISGISAAGSQGTFFKINTFGEEAFLEKLSEIID